MERNGSLTAAVALLCILSIVLSAGLMSATTPGSDLGEDPRAGGGGQGQQDGQQGQGQQDGQGQQGQGDQPGQGQPGDGSPGPDGQPAMGPGVGSTDPTSVGSVPGPGHLTNGTGAVILSFTVHSERDGYFRFAAYDEYTGAGWTRPGETRRFEEPLAPPPGNATRVVQRFRAERPVAVLPAAWKPVAVPARDADAAAVTSQGGLAAARTLAEGERYTVVSRVPNATPAEMRNATGPYPDAVAERYTRVPADTPDRVAELASEVTAGTNGSYESAMAVQRWLRDNKKFSLNVSRPPGDVADAFLFEMDAGYCEYYATAMAVLLRTQGVPARYVVGFTEGSRVGNDTYRLYSADTHAWVEVYVRGVGWVRFDPTPQAARETAGGRAVARDPPEDPARPPDEDFLGRDPSYVGPYTAEDDDRVGSRRPRESDRVGDRDGVREDPQLPPGYEVSVAGDPIPGATVVTTVTADGEPAQGVTVLFNGEAVGTTNESGQVRGRVPYDERLVVNVSAPGRSGRLVAPRPGAAGGAAGGRAPDAAGAGRVPAALSRAANNSTLVYDLNTSAALRVEGTPRAGTRVTVAADIEGVPVRRANVTVDGVRLARTDGDGRATVTLPFRDAVRLTVERGAANATVRVDVLPAINLSFGGYVVPGGEATVVASRHGRPVEGATVSAGGRTVGRTGPDGRLRVAVPLGLSLRVAAERGAAYGERGVLLVGWYLAGGAAVLAVAGLVRAQRRHDAGSRAAGGLARLVAALVGAARWAAARAVGVGEWVAAALPALAAWAAARLVGLAVLAGRLFDRAGAGLRRLLARLPALARRSLALLASPRRLLGLLWQGVRRTPGRAWAWLRGLGRTAGASEMADLSGVATAAADAESDQAALTVFEAWREMVRLLPVRADPSRTPSELARHAVEAGVPQDPVYSLTETFREVRYGGRDSTEESAGRARRALAAVRRWVAERRRR